MELTTLQFLKQLYSLQCEHGDFIILSVKGPDVPWKDVPIKYGPDISKRLKNFFRTYPIKDYDLYFSPMPYSKPNRRIENSLDTKFLAQDIDEHENPEELDPAPSFLWESSPNKYQGLWELDRYIEEEEYTPLNRSLAQHLDFDDCYDFVHVYRIPGTINHKYKNKPRVSAVTPSKKIYRPKTLQRKLGVSTVAQPQEITPPEGASLTERKIYAKYSIPQDVRDLLALDDLTGVDRSGMIWYIEHKLYELGMTPNEIIHLVRNSAFNKYKGRPDEVRRLKRELEKIISGDISPKQVQDLQSLKVTSFMDVMSNPNTFEGWLVKGFWGKRSHGIVAGMPKTFKSTLVHDLVVSVASGTPFLGKYPVLDPGPVIVVQNENADYVMKDRTEKLILHRGLAGVAKPSKEKKSVQLEFPEELPISFLNQQGFLLSNAEHRAALENLIKETQPVLVILDPLYLMFDGDLNSAKDLNSVLNWLLYLKNEYKTSVMLIHHYNKGGIGASRGGSRMMGSVILYGWVESAWYLSKEEDVEGQDQPIDEDEVDTSSKAPAKVTMNREFRMAGQHPEIDIHIKMGGIGDPFYDVDVTLAGEPTIATHDVQQEIIKVLEQSPGAVTRRQLVESFGISNRDMRKLLDSLLRENKIITTNKGFSVYKGFAN